MRQSTRTRTISAGVSSLLDHKGRTENEKKKKERGGEEKRKGGNEIENGNVREVRNGTKGAGGVESRSPPRLQ